MEFTPDERRVFPFSNGSEQVFGDPLEIHDRMTDLLDGDPQRTLEAAKSLDPRARYQAKRRLYAAVREAFDLPFDRRTGTGATLADCVQALNAFTAWMEAHKKKQDASPTVSPPTGADSPAPAPMPPMSGFGSIPAASTPVAPPRSPAA